MEILKFSKFQILENEQLASLENDILENWESYYEASHGEEIPYGKYGVSTIMGEVWTIDCIEHLLDEDDVDDDDLWDYVQDEIDKIVLEEKWDGYVYIDPETSEEQFGITIFYRY